MMKLLTYNYMIETSVAFLLDDLFYVLVAETLQDNTQEHALQLHRANELSQHPNGLKADRGVSHLRKRHHSYMLQHALQQDLALFFVLFIILF